MYPGDGLANRLMATVWRVSEEMARIAVLFPGQGAQKVGMGRDFAENRPD